MAEEDDNAIMIPITLKWGKKIFQLTITNGEAASSFKERVQQQTGVPLARQKLLAKKGWKGPLKDDVVLDTATTIKAGSIVTLIGSAETLQEPTTKTQFLEDLTPEDLKRAEEEELQAAIGTATGMIQALQLPPHRRDDGKQEFYPYNRLVTGLPQRQMEQDLKDNNNNGFQWQGKIAMTLGLELRRAYVNDLAVLEDGTCVSVLDDGHVQLWKHAAQQDDVVHLGPQQEGPVNSVVALKGGNFATAGRGSVQLWNADAEPIANLSGAMPGTTPASLTCVYDGSDNSTCLAARFQITRQNNPQQFRLPPQNETERQRRAQAEAQEESIQQALARASKSIQVWCSVGNTTTLQSQLLEPPVGEAAAPITCLTSLSLLDGTKVLVAGDMAGGIRLWRVQQRQEAGGLQFVPHGLFQFLGSSIVCMEPLADHRLAISTNTSNNNNTQPLPGATPIATSATRAVHILDLSIEQPTPTLQTSLTGHDKDAVICMCALPNGDLLTGGGKLDATLQLWSQSQLLLGEGRIVSTSHKKFTGEIGYVFSIAVLPDAKRDSNYFAVAVARYNTVKILL